MSQSTFDLGLLIGAGLILLAILASKITSRASVPVLVLFLLLGMLAGSEGIGGLVFEDYTLANRVATVALAFILFNGGLETPSSSIRAVWKPASVLATVGVVLTAALVALAAWALLGLPLVSSFVLGSIVSSTDAAAVFAILRGRGVSLQPRLAATLEVESASNDPMAVFLTVATLGVMQGVIGSPGEMAVFFGRQLLIGVASGIVIGKLGVWLINRAALETAGFYPILGATIGLISFSLTATLGGSGFLAIYLTGIILGNSDLVYRQGILLFHDGIAWFSQISMFLLLGLLSSPSGLFGKAGDGLLMAAALTFVARPIAVILPTLPFKFRWKELVLLSWGGLKGAVPVILATYPLLAGVEGGQYIFDLVFFVVLVSALTQGWTLPGLARMLRLQREFSATPPARLDITSLQQVDAEIVEYAIFEDSPAAGHLLRDLPLPDGVLVAMLSRKNRLVPASGATQLQPGDYVFVMSRRDMRSLVDRIFSSRGASRGPVPKSVKFPLRGETTVADLHAFYDLLLDAEPNCTLQHLLTEQFGRTPCEGESVEIGDYILVAKTVRGDHVERVTLELARAANTSS